jgi:thioesterase domain-containing protein/acyl carrier protein
MLEIWKRVLGTEAISAYDDFFNLGGHSMLALELFAEIDEEFGVSLPLSVLFEAPTVASLVRRIEKSSNTNGAKLIIPMQPLGRKSLIFAVPSGGNSVLMYRSLAQSLGNDYPFYGLEHPGLSDGKTLENVEEIAPLYLEEMRQLHPDRSCIVIGNCSGALIAYELARLLVSEGRIVKQVILINPPDVNEGPGHSRNWWRWQRVKTNLIAFGELRGLDRFDFLRDRLRLVREIIGSWIAGDPDLPVSQERVYEASRLAVRNYSARPYSGEITIVLGMRNVLSGWQNVCAIPPKVRRYYGSTYRKDRYPPIEGDPGGHIREYLERES